MCVCVWMEGGWSMRSRWWGGVDSTREKGRARERERRGLGGGGADR